MADQINYQKAAQKAREEGQDGLGLIVYAASLVMTAWDDAIAAQQRAKGALGPEQQEAAQADQHRAMIIVNLAMSTLRTAFASAMPPGDGGG
jgi:hypothetical protein